MRLFSSTLLVLSLLLAVGASPRLAHAQEDGTLYPMQKKSNWGFVNAEGEWEIEPTYPHVGAFREGLAIARTADENQWGFLNANGEWAIPPEFGQTRAAYRTYGDRRWYDAPVDPFHNGLAPARIDGSLAFINKQGKTVKRFPSYSELRPFHEARAVFSIDEKKGYINENWEVVIEPEFEEAGAFHDGLAVVQKSFGAPYGYIDRDGNAAIEPQFDEAGDFSNGLAPAKPGAFKPYGYVNTEGKWAIEPRFEEAHSFSEGLAFVETESGRSYISRDGTAKITSPISGYKLCQGSPFNGGRALVSVVKKTEDCGASIGLGAFEKPTNSAFAYINTSGEIVYRQSFANGRYLKRIQDSIDASERRAEMRRKKEEAREERRELAQCADTRAFGDSTAQSYVEIGYGGITRRYHYTNDVFEKTGSDTFRYHVPSFHTGSGHPFLELQPVTLEPSFMDESKLEVKDLGYRFSLGGRVLQKNQCIKFPSDATENGSIMNVEKKGTSGLWKSGQIKFTNPDNSENYILIAVHPTEYKTPDDDSGTRTGSVDGFLLDDDERISLTSQDDIRFKHYPRQEKLDIRVRATESLEGEGAGQRVYNTAVEVEDFDGTTGTYVNDPVHRFDEHHVEYFKVSAYSDSDVRVKHYKKELPEREDAPAEETTIDEEALSFSGDRLVGRYEGAGPVTAVDLAPVVYSLTN